MTNKSPQTLHRMHCPPCVLPVWWLVLGVNLEDVLDEINIKLVNFWVKQIVLYNVGGPHPVT